MPTWKLNPQDDALLSVLNEFIKRRGIDVSTRRGQARVRAIRALIEAVATNNPDALVPHYGALEEGDDESLFALVEDWLGSLKRMSNDQRRPSHPKRK